MEARVAESSGAGWSIRPSPARRDRRPSRRPARWLWWPVTAYGLVAVTLAGAGMALGDATWWLDAANTLSFWWLTPSLALTLLALLRRRVAPAAACGMAAAAWLALYGPLFLPQRQVGEADLRVASYNVYAETRPGVDHIVDFVEAVDPDVVLLQEIRRQPQLQLPTALPDHPYQWYAPRPDRFAEVVGVASRFPIVDVKPIAGLPDGARATAVVTLDVDGRQVQVVSVHLTSPCLACPVSEQATELADRGAVRVAEAEAVAAAVDAGPLILGGDLNSSTLNEPRRILLGAGLRDLHRAAGWGTGATRIVGPIVVRVDWLFATPDVQPVAVWTGDFRASDHRPVVADVRLAQG